MGVFKKNIFADHHLWLLIAAFMAMACKNDVSPVYTILKGKLPTGKVEVQINYGKDWEILPLSADGTFIDTLEIQHPQYVYLRYADFDTRLYFTQGATVIVSSDSEVSFSGRHADINTYLYEEFNDNLALEESEFNNHQKIFSKNETDYILYRDSIRDDRLTRLKAVNVDDPEFQEFHRKDIDFQHQYNIARYPNYHSYYYQDYKATELISDYLNDVTVDNENFALNYAGFRSLVDLVLDKKIENNKDENLNPLMANLQVLEDIQSPTILHNRLQNALFYFTVNEENMEEVRDKMLKLAKQERTKKLINKHYEVISKLRPGSTAPYFKFENYDGGHTELTDFRGKYVYIDVWATWCTPCIREIPYFKEIEKEFSNANIEFVSVSVDEGRFYDSWRKMIDNKNLSGYQLIADDGWNSEFVRNYGIQGIPRFILLDKEGNIVSADAEKPSDPKLKERLLTLEL